MESERGHRGGAAKRERKVRPPLHTLQALFNSAHHYTHYHHPYPLSSCLQRSSVSQHINRRLCMVFIWAPVGGAEGAKSVQSGRSQ